MIPLPLNDDDTGKLDLVLGQTYSLLDCAGEETACELLRTAVLTLRRDGGFFHPTPGDNWTADTYEAVLTVERELRPGCTPETKEVIWRTLETLLSQLGRSDVQGLVVEGDTRPLPNIPPDWRAQAAAPATPIVRGLRLPFSTTEFDVTRGVLSLISMTTQILSSVSLHPIRSGATGLALPCAHAAQGGTPNERK